MLQPWAGFFELAEMFGATWNDRRSLSVLALSALRQCGRVSYAHSLNSQSMRLVTALRASWIYIAKVPGGFTNDLFDSKAAFLKRLRKRNETHVATQPYFIIFQRNAWFQSRVQKNEKTKASCLWIPVWESLVFHCKAHPSVKWNRCPHR